MVNMLMVLKKKTFHPPFKVTLSTYIISLGGCPFHPSVPSSIHPSSSSWKKKMMEEEDEDEWRQQQFIQMFM
jgi:hypothetical protein